MRIKNTVFDPWLVESIDVNETHRYERLTIYWGSGETTHLSRPTQFKLMLFKGQLYKVVESENLLPLGSLFSKDPRN